MGDQETLGNLLHVRVVLRGVGRETGDRTDRVVMGGAVRAAVR